MSCSDFRSKGLPVETWRMSSKRYLVLQGRIPWSSHYDDISMKSLTQRQFCDTFSNNSGDVVIQFDGITTQLTVPWRNFINVSRCIMLFGFPFEQGRSFAKLFWKMKVQHAHHIFRQFASEYFGDSWASSMLFIKYQQTRLDAAAEIFMSSQGNTSSASKLFHDSLFKTKRAQLFQYWFDRYCEHAFLNCMISYNNYSQPLLVPDDFMNYPYLSKRIFPQQWEFLATAHGIYSQDADNLLDCKERQIFMVVPTYNGLLIFEHWNIGPW